MNRTIQRFFVALVVPSPLQEEIEQIKQEFGDRYQKCKVLLKHWTFPKTVS
ncbi:hypothetical protein PMG71_12620 [Roseofilum sp. BLCC_M154]|uniref:Transposase n=1 Tax=Roseofilum acuticapitatum BLCC-M154 TaxID=3022444 RepID=A0ABT7ATR5_9CYAN|nr:hypothetical protein [Roseofilum acuticapitatum]MDJ1170275.1 hypothetical protein [Roseofilum acuticapitatum BLCC-M154]